MGRRGQEDQDGIRRIRGGKEMGWNDTGLDTGIPSTVMWPSVLIAGVGGTSVDIDTTIVPNSVTDLHSLVLRAGSGHSVNVKTQVYNLPVGLLGVKLQADVPYATADPAFSGTATAEVVFYDKAGVEQRAVAIWSVSLQRLWADVFPTALVATQGTEVAVGFRYTWAGTGVSGGNSYWMRPRLAKRMSYPPNTVLSELPPWGWDPPWVWNWWA
jgi:hypothetical protein